MSPILISIYYLLTMKEQLSQPSSLIILLVYMIDLTYICVCVNVCVWVFKYEGQ